CTTSADTYPLSYTTLFRSLQGRPAAHVHLAHRDPRAVRLRRPDMGRLPARAPGDDPGEPVLRVVRHPDGDDMGAAVGPQGGEGGEQPLPPEREEFRTGITQVDSHSGRLAGPAGHPRRHRQQAVGRGARPGPAGGSARATALAPPVTLLTRATASRALRATRNGPRPGLPSPAETRFNGFSWCARGELNPHALAGTGT